MVMKDFAKQYGWNVYSQNGEDGIVCEAIKRINPSLKTAVEFGGADGFFCSNTARLREEGWQVIMYDKRGNDFVIEKEITLHNVNEIPDCSVLSIDIDGADMDIWSAYKGSPDLVIIEINSSINPGIEFYHPARGCSFCTMNRLAEIKGYLLLCHTGNCIYIHNRYKELFPEHVLASFNHSWL